MRRSRLTRVLLGLSVVTVARFRAECAASPSPSVADWRQDLDATARDIRVLHPDPFTKIGRLTFYRRVAQLRESIPSLTEEQRVVEMMRLVTSLGDGQTQLEPLRRDFASWYPIRLYEFTDGVFVVTARKDVAELAGAQLLELGGSPPDQFLARARSLMSADNASGSLEALYALHNARLMRGLGYASENGDLAAAFRLTDGTVVRRTLHPMTENAKLEPEDATFDWRDQREMHGPPGGADWDWISAYRATPLSAFETTDPARPAHLADRSRYSARSMPGQDAFYARMDILDDGFMPFLDSVMKQVDAQKPRRLIIDWRYNFGGDGSIVPAMAREFIKRQGDPPWQELYVLTGRRTGVMALHALLGQVPLTIVGEPPGSGLNHYGDATSRTYPRTGLRLRVSTLWWQLGASDDIREYLPVDVAAPFSSADYANGRDPAVDPILRGEEMRSISMIAISASGADARRALEERRKRFSRYPWWSPPAESDLRQTCQELRAKKRYGDALDVCALNAELHPYDWSSWLNLGQAQRATGLAAGLGSYRCVLLVDPSNPEADGIKAFLKTHDPDNAVALPTGCPYR